MLSALFFEAFEFDDSRIGFSGIRSSKNYFTDYRGVILWASAILLITAGFLYEIANYNMRPKIHEIYDDSKIDAKISIFIKTIQIINCLLYYILKTTVHQIHLIICMIMYGISTLAYLKSLPHYSFLTNLYKTFFQLSLTCVSTFFLIGIWLNNPLSVILLTIVLQPIIFIISLSLVQYFFNYYTKNSDSSSSFTSLELQNRSLVRCSSDNSLLSSLNSIYLNSKIKKFRIIGAYYSLDKLENASLALNLIGSLNFAGIDIDENYQVFKCKSIMMNICKNISVLYKTQEYIERIQEIRLRDKEFCKIFHQFLNLVIRDYKEMNSLKKWLKEVVEKWKKLESLYIDSINEFQFSKEIKELYALFLLDIKNDSQAAQLVFNKINKSTIKNSISLSVHNSNHGLVMISGDIETFGLVKFMNKDYLTQMKFTSKLVDNFNMKSLLPSSIYAAHEKSMKEMIRDCHDYILYDDMKLLVLDGEGHLDQIVAKAGCIIKNNSINFIFNIVFLKHNLELAIISPDGFLFEHSRGFPFIIRQTQSSVSSHFIQEYLPELDFLNLKLHKYQEYNLGFDSEKKSYRFIYLQIKIIKIFKEEIFVLYISDQTTLYELKEEEYIIHNEKNLDQSLISCEMKSEESEYSIPNKSKIYSKISELNENKSKISSSSISNLQLNKKEQKSYKRSLIVIYAAKVILIILVLFK